MEPKQAEGLRGRMPWFEGYASGRVVQCSLKVLGDIALKKQRCATLDSRELAAVEFLLRRVSDAGAAKINFVFLDAFFVFTDGACEGESQRVGSVGGVLVDPSGHCIQHFSSKVPGRFMNVASDNPIYVLELLPLFIAAIMWGPILTSSHVVFFLDNDAARAVLCKGYGGTELAQKIVQDIMCEECQLELKPWYTRVPSHSNISDGPSRLDCTEVEQLGSSGMELDWECIPENFLR